MIGAIAGDVIGSPYEFRRNNTATTDFPLFIDRSDFTDDTIHTVALAESILRGTPFVSALKDWSRRYPNPKGGYGDRFSGWMRSESTVPYGSFGNGSGMRVSPVAWAYDDLEAVLAHAKASAVVTHDHPAGIAGAEAIAGATFLARTGHDKPAIRRFVEEHCGYDLGVPLADVPGRWDCGETCPESVPPAIIAFLAGESFEDAVRKAIVLGGDSDTIAAMTGAFAHAFFGMPHEIVSETLARLDAPLRAVTEEFMERYRVLR